MARLYRQRSGAHVRAHRPELNRGASGNQVGARAARGAWRAVRARTLARQFAADKDARLLRVGVRCQTGRRGVRAGLVAARRARVFRVPPR